MSVLVKGAALAKELLVAREFGAGEDYDAFLIAYVLLAFGITVCSDGLKASLVPKYVEVREVEGPEAAQQLLGNAICIGAALLLATACLLAALAPTALPLIASGFGEAELALCTRLFYTIVPVLPIAGLTAIVAGVVNTKGRFGAVAIAPIATPVSTVIALVMFGDRIGAGALAGGLVVGALVEAFVVVRIAVRAQLLRRVRWAGFTPATRRVVAQYRPMVLGAMILGLTPLIDSAMATSLGEGSVSRLTYGYKIVGPLISIGALAISTAALPIISSMAARRDWAGTRESFYRLSAMTLALALPIAALLVAFAEPIVRLMFERGEFSAADTSAVAGIQVMFAAQLPLFAIASACVRFISALGANRILLVGNVISVTVNVTLNYVLMRRIGVAGIALATSLTTLIATVYLTAMMLRTLASRDQPADPLPGGTP